MNTSNIRLIILILMLFLAVSLFFSPVIFPEVVLLFDTSKMGWFDKLSAINIILHDDVMITMRVAKFFLEHGYLGFNLSDISQPATSYLLPIYAALFFALFNDNISLALVSFTGAFSLLSAIYIIVKDVRKEWQIIIILMAFINATTLYYMFSGWEHCFQIFFIIFAWSLVWHVYNNNIDCAYEFMLIGISSALSFLFRVDSIFLVIPIFGWLILSRRDRGFLISFFVFLCIVLLYFFFQYKWFGNFFPTTARLKASQLPDMDYSIRYIVTCIKHGSAISFLLAMAAIYLWRIKYSIKEPAIYAIFGIIVNCLYSFFVSDVFMFGRMYLAPLFVALLVASRELFDNDYVRSDKKIYRVIDIKNNAIFVIFMALSLFSIEKQNMSKLVQRFPEVMSSTVEQLILAKYIKKNFDPHDGAIGQFWLGTVSFYLPEYEIADFLGKADEDIARTKSKWGPPGHNKWDVNISMSKWKPVVIPFPSDIALNSLENLKIEIDLKRDFSFWSEYALAIRGDGYIFCKPYFNLNFGLFIRSDLINKARNCKKIEEDNKRD